MEIVIYVVLASFTLSACSERINYTGYAVKRITPKTESQLAALKQLENIGALFWKEPSARGRPADVLLPPNLQGEMVNILKAMGSTVENLIENIQVLIDNEESAAKRTGQFGWTAYSSFEEINAFLLEQHEKHPNYTRLFSIGKSFEGRDLLVFKISRGSKPKKSIWLDANIHAREWITSAVATFTINELLNGERTGWTRDFDWYILSILNPDGFVYTKTNNRLWRKTRSTGLRCIGADANRNFGFHWMESGSSNNPCSETYGGKSAFSELETQALRDYIPSISKHLVGYISLHSYSQLILLPYGHSNKHIPQYDTYMDLGHRIAQATATRYQTMYTTGNIVDLLYAASGGSMDWVKGTHNINLTLTFELRDTGRYGFLLPPTEIIPTAEEFLDGLEVIVQSLRDGIITPDFKEH
ncbi:unnamed protein product [Allacma fusca]|uniref:Peptidase M14 domain-containing protein n=1 Tax=Allacma fusca TaxID=39272 RepID=A0A8J2NQX0_9HEXA|nr:unnamed protein product [Allacma fusca]